MKKRSYSKKTIILSICLVMSVCLTGTVLASIFSPSGNNMNSELKGNEIVLSKDWNWKNNLDEITEQSIFKDIVSEEAAEEVQDQSIMDRFFADLSQQQKESTKEKDIAVLTSPVPDGKITSPFGKRVNPVTKEHKFHFGVDYAQKEGSDIVAVNDGKVIATSKDLGWVGYYGYYIIVAHQNGTASLYAHCRSLLVNSGDMVKKGDKIAEIGSTGCSTGPHCHFEFRVNGEAVDPIVYM